MGARRSNHLSGQAKKEKTAAYENMVDCPEHERTRIRTSGLAEFLPEAQ